MNETAKSNIDECEMREHTHHFFYVIRTRIDFALIWWSNANEEQQFDYSTKWVTQSLWMVNEPMKQYWTHIESHKLLQISKIHFRFRFLLRFIVIIYNSDGYNRCVNAQVNLVYLKETTTATKKSFNWCWFVCVRWLVCVRIWFSKRKKKIIYISEMPFLTLLFVCKKYKI